LACARIVLTATPETGSIQYSVPAAPPQPTLPALRPHPSLLRPSLGAYRAIPVVQSASPFCSFSLPSNPRTMLSTSAMSPNAASGSEPAKSEATDLSDNSLCSGAGTDESERER
jgi:hypothetical protein